MKYKDPKRVEQIRPNVLVYGPPKTGKTTFALSADGGKLALNFDLDNATHYARLRDTEGSILEPEFEGMQTLDEVEAEAKKDDPFMDVVTVDPVGDLHRTLMELESKYAVRPSRDVYGDVAVRVERFCRALCMAPKVSCVIVAHDDPVKDEQSGQVMRAPFTGTSNPKLGRKLLGMVDVIAYTGVVEPEDAPGHKTGVIEYWAQLVPANGRVAGDRFGVLGKKRLMGRVLADGTPDPEVRGLAEWFEVINANAAKQPQKEQSPNE